MLQPNKKTLKVEQSEKVRRPTLGSIEHGCGQLTLLALNVTQCEPTTIHEVIHKVIIVNVTFLQHW